MSQNEDNPISILTKNVLVFGQFTNNRGDQAQGIALAYKIKEVSDDIRITFVYFQHDYPVHRDCGFIKNIFVSARRAMFGAFKSFMLGRAADPMLSLLRECDVLVMPPGGPYIGDMYNFEHELYRALMIFWAKHYGKKVMIYAPSMGPFKSIIKRNVHRYILTKADTVAVRDGTSKAWLDALMPDKKTYLTADAAIQRVLTEREISNLLQEMNVGQRSETYKVGVTPIDLTWHPKWGKGARIEEFNEKIVAVFSEVIVYLMTTRNAQIYFYPQLYGMQDDLKVIEKIIKRLERMGAGCGNMANVIVLDPGSTSDHHQALISSMDLFIGARYHSLVFSAMYNVPFVGLYYEHKTKDLVGRLSMEKYSLAIEDIETERILAMIEDIRHTSSDARNTLRNRMETLRMLSSMNNQLLYELIKDKNN